MVRQNGRLVFGLELQGFERRFFVYFRVKTPHCVGIDRLEQQLGFGKNLNGYPGMGAPCASCTWPEMTFFWPNAPLAMLHKKIT
jgi:hypothetical protein